MKRVFLLAGVLTLTASAAQACPRHEGGYGEFDIGSVDEVAPSNVWEPVDASPEAKAIAAAAQAQALENAKSAFLARFGFKAEAAPAAAQSSAPNLIQASLQAPADADPSPRPDAQDR